MKWIKENHTVSENGTGRNSAARTIVNLNELSREAIEMGSIVEVVYLEGMSVLDQMKAFRRADVIVAAHGSAWANTAFMRHDTAAIQVYVVWCSSAKRHRPTRHSNVAKNLTRSNTGTDLVSRRVAFL